MRIACNACQAEVSHNHKRDPRLDVRPCPKCGAVGNWTPFPGLPTAKAKGRVPVPELADVTAQDLPEELRDGFTQAAALFAAKLGRAQVAPGASAWELPELQTTRRALAEAEAFGDAAMVMVKDALRGVAQQTVRAEELHAQLDAAEANAREADKLRERLRAAEADAEACRATFADRETFKRSAERVQEGLARKLALCLKSLEAEDSGEAQKVLAMDLRRQLEGEGYAL